MLLRMHNRITVVLEDISRQRVNAIVDAADYLSSAAKRSASIGRPPR